NRLAAGGAKDEAMKRHANRPVFLGPVVSGLVVFALLAGRTAGAEPPPWSDARQGGGSGRILADAVAPTPPQRALQPAPVKPSTVKNVTPEVANQPPVVPPAPEQVIDL